jgi:purine nucleoside permease
MKFRKWGWLTAWVLAGLACGHSAEVGPKLAVKFVILTDLDIAAKRGHPGLFEAWVSGEHFGTTFSSPGVEHPVKSDGNGALAVLVGAGDQAAVQVMALAEDERFDLTGAYWLVTGIGCANPDQLSLGSVAWGTRVVGGDRAFELDRADAPGDWPYGVVPLDVSNVPVDYPAPSPRAPAGVVYSLNPQLAKLGFSLSQGLSLPELPAARSYRGTFAGYQGAIRPPFVLSGAILGSTRAWHGKVLNQWATDWVQYWSKGSDPFVLSDSSDHTIMAALTTLAQMGRINFNRVMVERAAWAYTMTAPNQPKDKSLDEDFPGLGLAAASAFLAGRPVFHEITGNWKRYADQAP